MKTPTRFYLFVSGVLLVTMLLSYSTVDPVSRALADEGRPVELKLDVAPASQGSQNPPADLMSPDDAVELWLDDNSVDNGIGFVYLAHSYQIIWLNRFTPDSSLYPFALNQIFVFFDETADSGVSAGDAIDLVVYSDADGDPSNGATLLATFNTTVVAADGSNWSGYNLATPVEISGPGDVLIGVIPRFIESGVTGPTYPAAIDTTASQGRSWLGNWTSDPPDPAELPPNGDFDIVDNLVVSGNWMIRGAGVTSGAGGDSEIFLPLVVKNLGPPSAPTLNAISNSDGDGNYTVSWSSVSGASNYVLEEDDNASFSTPSTVYDNSGTSTGISGRDVGVYYYRVRAENSSGISGWSGTQSVVVTVEPPPCSKYEFGSTNVQYYVYSDGRSWSFTAEENMAVKTINTKSILASTGGTFYIQVKINDNVEASWSQYVSSVTYQPYYHSADVSLNVNAGDTIAYYIYGGTYSTPVGGILGVNYVELCTN